MAWTYVVLGAGRQGVALAYDLAARGEAERITLADLDAAVAQRAVSRLQSLLPDARCSWTAAACDVARPDTVTPLLRGAHVALSAVPYRYNVGLTDAAIAAGASFCDLGGNTQVVQQQLARHDRARAAGVSVVPDCGLAPGLGNTLAAHGIAAMTDPQDVHVRCGGLPERPVGPLGYKLVFNFDGLVNEYSGCGEFLRDGRPANVPALTELEEIEFPPPVGRCEAAVTSGGTSTCAQTYAGRLRAYDYKTVRYPGHFAIVRALFELGCFDETVRLGNAMPLSNAMPPSDAMPRSNAMPRSDAMPLSDTTLAPRPLFRKLLEERLRFPDVRDLVVLRCTVRGRDHGRPCTRQYDLLDRHDERTGFTAMERTTAFPAALVAHMQARGLVAPGARPLEVAVPPEPYLAELPRHDIHIVVGVHHDEHPAG